jgi:hypothetical protein
LIAALPCCFALLLYPTPHSVKPIAWAVVCLAEPQVTPRGIAQLAQRVLALALPALLLPVTPSVVQACANALPQALAPIGCRRGAASWVCGAGGVHLDPQKTIEHAVKRSGCFSSRKAMD